MKAQDPLDHPGELDTMIWLLMHQALEGEFAGPIQSPLRDMLLVYRALLPDQPSRDRGMLLHQNLIGFAPLSLVSLAGST